MERKAFNFYKSYYDVALELPINERLPFLMAIIEMQFTGIEPTNLKGLSKFAFISQKHSILKQIEGYKHGTKTKHPDRVPDSPPIEDPANKNKNKDKRKNKGNRAKPKPQRISFEDSEIFDKNNFAKVFEGWSKTKMLHYYEAAHRYSIEGNKYVSWELAIKTWERKDVANKVNIEPTKEVRPYPMGLM